MKQKIPYLLSYCLLGLLSACSSWGGVAELLSAEQAQPKAIVHLSAATQTDAMAAIPPEMRLGAPYVSALGESCYQVLSAADAVTPVRAICLRGQIWTLLPLIYMDTPAGGVIAPRA